MNENNFGEGNLVENEPVNDDLGYQMSHQQVEDQNPIVPPLNVQNMPSGDSAGYSAPHTANNQIPPLPVSHQANKYSMGSNANNHFAQQSVMSAMSKNTARSNAVTLQSSIIQPNDAHIRAALEIDHRYIDKNIHETLERLNSYDIHQKKLIQMKEDTETKKLLGVRADQNYTQVKYLMMNNKLKTHEHNEYIKISEIKRNNQHLLDKLLHISKSKNCTLNQKNLKVERAPSKSLNYVSKKREAERIDRENQKIMQRIINVKPQMIRTSKLQKDFKKNHVEKRKMLQDRNQGVFLEDLLENKQRFRDNGTHTSMLPRIAPQTSTSVSVKKNLYGSKVAQRIDTTQMENNNLGSRTTVKNPVQSNYSYNLMGKQNQFQSAVISSAGHPERAVRSQLGPQNMMNDKYSQQMPQVDNSNYVRLSNEEMKVEPNLPVQSNLSNFNDQNSQQINLELSQSPQKNNEPIQITDNQASATKASQHEYNVPTSLNNMTASLSKTDGGLISEYNQKNSVVPKQLQRNLKDDQQSSLGQLSSGKPPLKKSTQQQSISRLSQPKKSVQQQLDQVQQQIMSNNSSIKQKDKSHTQSLQNIKSHHSRTSLRSGQNVNLSSNYQAANSQVNLKMSQQNSQKSMTKSSVKQQQIQQVVEQKDSFKSSKSNKVISKALSKSQLSNLNNDSNQESRDQLQLPIANQKSEQVLEQQNPIDLPAEIPQVPVTQTKSQKSESKQEDEDEYEDAFDSVIMDKQESKQESSNNNIQKKNSALTTDKQSHRSENQNPYLVTQNTEINPNINKVISKQIDNNYSQEGRQGPFTAGRNSQNTQLTEMASQKQIISSSQENRINVDEEQKSQNQVAESNQDAQYSYNEQQLPQPTIPVNKSMKKNESKPQLEVVNTNIRVNNNNDGTPNNQNQPKLYGQSDYSLNESIPDAVQIDLHQMDSLSSKPTMNSNLQKPQLKPKNNQKIDEESDQIDEDYSNDEDFED